MRRRYVTHTTQVRPGVQGRRCADRPGDAHALRHTFGTALAEAGVGLAVMQALLGHARIDTTARYVHLAPIHVKAEFEAARRRQRADT